MSTPPLGTATAPSHFRVQTEGRTVGWFSEASGLSAEYEVVEHQEGGAPVPTKLRGRLKYPNLVLKRGVVADDALLAWFTTVQGVGARPSVSLEMLDPTGKPTRRWTFREAVPVKWTGPTLAAGGSTAATETLEIAHHGLAPGSSAA